MDRFTFHREYYEIIQRLKKPQDRALLSLALIELVFEEKQPENLSEVAEMAFYLLSEKISKSKNNSGRGGRPKKQNGFETVLENKNRIETELKPNSEMISESENRIETKRKTVPMEKESNKEKGLTLEKDKNLQESKKERYINKTNNAGVCTHEELMQEWGLSKIVSDALKEFLRHCCINKQIVSNERLNDILVRLFDKYGNDDAGIVECIWTAIRGGYYDVKA